MATNALYTLVAAFVLEIHHAGASSGKSYRIFDREDWYRGHLDDTDCFDSPPQGNTTEMMLFCPIPNPYSKNDPLFVKLGSACGDEEGNICCLMEEDECPGGEVYCGSCLYCMFPQTLHGSCCGVSEQACDEETEVCCKCGINSYKCIPQGEECTECEEDSSPTPFRAWTDSTTTPTPFHEEF